MKLGGLYMCISNIATYVVDGTGTVRVRWRVNKVRSGISDSYQGTFRYTGPYPGYVPAVPRETYVPVLWHVPCGVVRMVRHNIGFSRDSCSQGA